MKWIRGNTHLVISTRKFPNIITPQASSVGQISKDGILIDTGFLLQEQLETS